MSGTALMYMLANMFLTQLFYVVGVGGVQVIYYTILFWYMIYIISIIQIFLLEFRICNLFLEHLW